MSGKLSAIVAYDQNRVIGLNNQLPWRLPADLKHFKQVTMGKPIVMGRKTWDSIGRALPGRENIVLTRQTHFHPEGCTVIHDLEALQQLRQQHAETLIIGGASVYQATLPLLNTLYITQINACFTGDTWFPVSDAQQWQIVEQQPHKADDNNPYDYCFLTLNRHYSKTR